jgi:tetratricopeptide (TPR) repeat protein
MNSFIRSKVQQAIIAILRRHGPMSTFKLIDLVRVSINARITEEHVLEVLATDRGSSFDRTAGGDWIYLKKKPPLDIPRELSACNRLYQQGHYSHVVQRATAVSKVQPNNFDAAVLLGNSHFKLGNYKKSISALRLAVRADPSNEAARELLVTALERFGRTKEAAIALEDLITLDERNPPRWSHLCALLYQTGQYSKLLEQFKTAPVSVKKDPEAVLVIAMGLERSNRCEEAVALYRYVVNREPTNDVAIAGTRRLAKRLGHESERDWS